jgi:2-oxoglutarate dehydrogenase E2 component (dihydrolipoamide succinyltransferase)
MTTEIKVPVLPESVADATVATWHVQVGEKFTRDQVLVDIETDKVVLEVPATSDGIMTNISQAEGATVLGDQVIGTFSDDSAEAETSEVVKSETMPVSDAKVIDIVVPVLPESVADATVASWHVAEGDTVLGAQKIGELNAGASASSTATATSEEAVSSDELASPSVRRLMTEKGLTAADVVGSGKGGRISKEDVEAAANKPAAASPSSAPTVAAPVQELGERSQKRVPMTRLRKTIATRLLEAKNSTAMLTTFNEVNMKPIMDLRKQYKELFEKNSRYSSWFYVFLRKSSYRST